MEVTRDQVMYRLEQLAAEHEEAVAQVHALSGAMQDCQYWLDVMDAREAMGEDDSHNELVSPIPEEA